MTGPAIVTRQPADVTRPGEQSPSRWDPPAIAGGVSWRIVLQSRSRAGIVDLGENLKRSSSAMQPLKGLLLAAGGRGNTPRVPTAGTPPTTARRGPFMRGDRATFNKVSSRNFVSENSRRVTLYAAFDAKFALLAKGVAVLRKSVSRLVLDSQCLGPLAVLTSLRSQVRVLYRPLNTILGLRTTEPKQGGLQTLDPIVVVPWVRRLIQCRPKLTPSSATCVTNASDRDIVAHTGQPSTWRSTAAPNAGLVGQPHRRVGGSKDFVQTSTSRGSRIDRL